MSHLVTPEQLKKWYTIHNSGAVKRPVWAIFRSEADASSNQKNCFAECTGEEGMSEKVGLAQLEEVIDNLMVNGTKYFVRLRSGDSKSGGSVNQAITYYTHKSENTTSQPSVQGIGNVDEFRAKIKEELREEMRREKELQDLKDEIKELKAGNPIIGAIKELLQMDEVKPLVPILISGITSKITPAMTLTKKAAIAGTQEEEQTQVAFTNELENNAKRLETALERWSNADPEFLDLIEKISFLAAEGSNKYNIAKTML